MATEPKAPQFVGPQPPPAGPVEQAAVAQAQAQPPAQPQPKAVPPPTTPNFAPMPQPVGPTPAAPLPQAPAPQGSGAPMEAQIPAPPIPTAPEEGEDGMALVEKYLDPELYKLLKTQAASKMSLVDAITLSGLAMANPRMAETITRQRAAGSINAKNLLAQLQTQAGNQQKWRDQEKEKGTRLQMQEAGKQLLSLQKEAAEYGVPINSFPIDENLGTPEGVKAFQTFMETEGAKVNKEAGKQQETDEARKLFLAKIQYRDLLEDATKTHVKEGGNLEGLKHKVELLAKGMGFSPTEAKAESANAESIYGDMIKRRSMFTKQFELESNARISKLKATTDLIKAKTTELDTKLENPSFLDFGDIQKALSNLNSYVNNLSKQEASIIQEKDKLAYEIANEGLVEEYGRDAVIQRQVQIENDLQRVRSEKDNAFLEMESYRQRAEPISKKYDFNRALPTLMESSFREISELYGMPPEEATLTMLDENHPQRMSLLIVLRRNMAQRYGDAVLPSDIIDGIETGLYGFMQGQQDLFNYQGGAEDILSPGVEQQLVGGMQGFSQFNPQAAPTGPVSQETMQLPADRPWWESLSRGALEKIAGIEDTGKYVDVPLKEQTNESGSKPSGSGPGGNPGDK